MNNNNSSISKCQKKVEDFLNNRRCAADVKYNYVSMGETFMGKFYLTYEEIEEFNKLYSKAINKGVIFNIAEKPKEYGPILVDIDLEKQ